MKVCLDFSPLEQSIIDTARLNETRENYLKRILEKHFFSNFGNAVKTTYSYFDQVEQLLALTGLKQQEIADFLEINQTTFSKALKQKNENSIVFTKMKAYGEPQDFVNSAFRGTLKKISKKLELKSNFQTLIINANEIAESIKIENDEIHKSFFSYLWDLYCFYVRKTTEENVDNVYLFLVIKKEKNELLQIFLAKNSEISEVESYYRSLSDGYSLITTYTHLK